MLIFFDPNSEYFAKYVAFCSHIFDFACFSLIAIEEVRNMEKLDTSKTCLKMAGGKDAYPLSYPHESVPGTSCRNHQKSLAYFSHFVPLVLFYY